MEQINSQMKRYKEWGVGRSWARHFCPRGTGVYHLPDVDVFANLEAIEA